MKLAYTSGLERCECSDSVTIVCYKSVTRVLQECYKSVTRVLQECYKSVAKKCA
jgi:hypothetical protein